jgi:hypothetical protein
MTTTTVTEPSVLDAAPRTLTAANDRCDRCGAQAWVLAIAPTPNPRSGEESELLFCHHHGKQHLPALEGKDFVIYDFTEKMYEEFDTSKWLKESN